MQLIAFLIHFLLVYQASLSSLSLKQKTKQQPPKETHQKTIK